MKWKVILKSHTTHGDSNKKWFFCFCFTEKEVGLDESVMGDPRALGLWPLIKSWWSGRKLSPRYFIRAQLDSIKTTNLVSLAFNSFAVWGPGEFQLSLMETSGHFLGKGPPVGNWKLSSPWFLTLCWSFFKRNTVNGSCAHQVGVPESGEAVDCVGSYKDQKIVLTTQLTSRMLLRQKN